MPMSPPQLAQLRAARRQRLAVERDRAASIASRPLMQRSSVVLPDPDAADDRDHLARLDVERDVVEDRDACRSA